MTTDDSDPFDFSGKSVLITGGTKGLGRTAAEAFLTRNASVTVCARREPEVPFATDAAAHVLTCDVRDPSAVSEMVAAAAQHMGGLDIVINNAGGAPPRAAAESDAAFNDKIVGLNLLAPMNVCVAAHPYLARSGGVILNVSSVSGMRANPLGVAYGAAKAGLINMSETLALEWGPQVRVVSITAGLLNTEGAQSFLGEAEMTRMADALALGRLGERDDVVNAMLFACSPLASWVTGSNLVIDGGPEWPQAAYQPTP